jgi:cytidine deaminase
MKAPAVEQFKNIEDLDSESKYLVHKAKDATQLAYAPYSKFHVGAALMLEDGTIVAGSNQENASYPVGICAERVLLSAISSFHPGIAIETMAVSYQSKKIKSDHPISPCGMCRQALQEFEGRMDKPIRLILSGMEGKVYVIKSASLLLPLAFTNEELG